MSRVAANLGAWIGGVGLLGGPLDVVGQHNVGAAIATGLSEGAF